MKAMILAAGRGERMRPLTDTTPKPLLKVGEYSIIEYHLMALKRAGVNEVIINVAHHANQIIENIGRKQYGIDITFSFEGDDPKGTGGGIRQALPLLGESPFILLSGDIMTDFDLSTLFEKTTSAAYLVLVENPEYHLEGDFRLLSNGQVSLGEPKLTYANIAVLHPKLFSACDHNNFPLAPILAKAIATGEVKGEKYNGFWHNIGTPQQLQSMQRLFAAKQDESRA